MKPDGTKEVLTLPVIVFAFSLSYDMLICSTFFSLFVVFAIIQVQLQNICLCNIDSYQGDP